MDHSFGVYVIAIAMFMIFGPLLLYLLRSLSPQPVESGDTAIEADSSWKDPEPLLAYLSFADGCTIVSDALPRYSYARGSWEIVNIENGIPTTISANMSCLDESDSSAPQRLEMGLILTLLEVPQEQSGCIIKFHYIPYEGDRSLLQDIADGTYAHLEQAINAASKSIVRARSYAQPPVVLEQNEPVEQYQQLGQQYEQNRPELEQPERLSRPEALERPEPLERPQALVRPEPLVKPEALTFPDAPGKPQAPQRADVFDSSSPVIFPDSAPEPISMPEPFVMPEPFSMPVLGGTSAPGSTDVLGSIPASVLSSPTSTSAPAPAGGEGQGAVCPGCNQPTNPSFPFCLYCGKNF